MIKTSVINSKFKILSDASLLVVVSYKLLAIMSNERWAHTHSIWIECPCVNPIRNRLISFSKAIQRIYTVPVVATMISIYLYDVTMLDKRQKYSTKNQNKQTEKLRKWLMFIEIFHYIYFLRCDAIFFFGYHCIEPWTISCKFVLNDNTAAVAVAAIK